MYKYFSQFLLTIVFFTASHSPLLAKTCENTGVGYWIGSNNNDVFDDSVIKEITDCASLVVLNTPLSTDNKYQLIVKRMHERAPKLPILGYTWLNTYYDRPRIGSRILSGVTKHEEWRLLSSKDSKLFRNGKKAPFLIDIRNPTFQKWAINKIVNTANQQGLDGIALDMVFRKPLTGRLGYWCKKSQKDCAKYSLGIDTYLKELKSRLGNKLLYINGIFPEKVAHLADQAQLLKYIDGVAIEYFGINPKSKEMLFTRDILPYLELIEKNPDKKFLIFGREPKSTKPQINTNLGKYLYASYLLVSGKNTSFKFHFSFQVNTKNSKRSNGLYLLDEQKYSLGKPLTKFIKQGALLEREFSNGYVAVNPDNATSASYIYLKSKMYDVTGRVHFGKTLISPGQSLILFKNKVL